MEDIARMADECMRDFDDDEEDENLEDDEDLLVCTNQPSACFKTVLKTWDILNYPLKLGRVSTRPEPFFPR